MASMRGDEVWTDKNFPAAYHPFLHCSVSEGSYVAFTAVLAAWALQMVEHAIRARRRNRAVIGQALFPKSVCVTPLQSQALEFIQFPSVLQVISTLLLNGQHPGSKAMFFSKSLVLYTVQKCCGSTLAGS